MHYIYRVSLNSYLGSSWTETQLSMLKRITSRLNIIPDSDIPKEREYFGVGFTCAVRTGKLALSLGFTMTIQDIPVSDWKNDPDSYLVSKDKLSLCLKLSLSVCRFFL